MVYRVAEVEIIPITATAATLAAVVTTMVETVVTVVVVMRTCRLSTVRARLLALFRVYFSLRVLFWL